MTRPTGTVGMISNPASGHNRDQFDAIRSDIEQCAAISHHITRSIADIDGALDALAAQKIDVLAINGGDGTASAILGRMLERQLFDEPPLIALLPGGTANMNAGDIGLKGSLAKAVQRFCTWCESERSTQGKLQQRSLLRLALQDSEAVHHGMFLGAGAIIQGTEYAHREIHSRGLRDDFSLALGTVRTVWGVLRDDPQFSQHVRIDITRNGGDKEQFDTLILVISTLQRLAFGMRPFWSIEPGSIRMTIFEQGCTRFARTFFSIIRGHPSRHAQPDNGYRSHNADTLELRLQGKLNLDGEIIEVDGSVHVCATQALEFLIL